MQEKRIAGHALRSVTAITESAVEISARSAETIEKLDRAIELVDGLIGRLDDVALDHLRGTR